MVFFQRVPWNATLQPSTVCAIIFQDILLSFFGRYATHVSETKNQGKADHGTKTVPKFVFSNCNMQGSVPNPRTHLFQFCVAKFLILRPGGKDFSFPGLVSPIEDSPFFGMRHLPAIKTCVKSKVLHENI